MFFALTPSLGYELYRTDGTPQTTSIVREICVGRCNGVVTDAGTAAVGATFYFAGSAPDSGQELWRSNGTAASTQLVADINPGASGSNARNFTRVGNLVYFLATNGGSNNGVWRSDGTAAGTQFVTSAGGGTISQLTAVGNRLFFTVANAGRIELWATDGTPAGSSRALSLNGTGVSIDNIVDFNGVAYFLANDAVTGRELWRSDGSAGNTSIVMQVATGIEGVTSQLAICRNRMWFLSTPSFTWVPTFSPPGTAPVESRAADLWVSSGTPGTTTMFRRFFPNGENAGPRPSIPQAVRQTDIASSNTAMFIHYRNSTNNILIGTQDRESLYTLNCDGVEYGTLTSEVSPMPGWFFTAEWRSSSFGNNVYVSTGKTFNLYGTDGTTVVRGPNNFNFNMLPGIGYGGLFTVTPGGLYYPASDPELGWNLYRAVWPNTVSTLVADIATEPGGSSNSNPLGQTWVEGQLDALGRVAGDFNGDGRSDILWRNVNDGWVTQWQMNGNQINAAYVYQVPTDYQIAGTGDFDGDGRTDILWRGPNGEVTMWLMVGFAIKQAAVVASVPFSYQIRGVGDFNGDGRADILWQGDTGEVNAWLMNGTRIANAGNVGFVTPFYRFVGTGDFNGDGRSDVMWRGTDSSIVTWQMNGLSPTGYFVAAVDDSWRIQGLRDMDADGRADVVWRNDNGSVALWLMNGSIPTPRGLGQIDADQAGQALGDYDGDRRGEILWRSQNGTLRRWNISSGVPVSTDFNTVTLDWQVQ
ncbi:FG-GAP-like repeat-containing protein [Sphingomonas sp.]|uniref:FG-GAP-like repeat-containing protein n=1 Tax=Sphingomonas sp. TaxID=28214 RepID=UPI0025CC5A8A|nr:FG-GAP-like repeat-containing protein [Sphingomonas sp.]